MMSNTRQSPQGKTVHRKGKGLSSTVNNKHVYANELGLRIPQSEGDMAVSSASSERLIMAERAPTVKESGGDGGGNDLVSSLSWYHPSLTRHAADCMLIDNAPEGSYLLRPSSDYESDGSYVLSVKLSSSVQHIRVINVDDKLLFGNSTFENVGSFRKHFEQEKPIIGGDSGMTVVLKFPYKKFVRDSHIYSKVVHHAVTNMSHSDSDDMETSSVENQTFESGDSFAPQSIGSKEGFLTKQGWIRKNWKRRWFVLRGYTFSYFRNKLSQSPISRLNLSEAVGIGYDYSRRKQYCFCVEFKKRTYYLQAPCEEDCHDWVELLRSKLQS